MSNIKNYKYDWIWDKVVSGSMLNCKKQPMRIVENIIVFNSKIYFPIMNDDGLEKAKERLSKKPKKQFKKTTLTGDYIQKTRSNYTLESQRYSYPKNILKYNKIKNECNSRKRLHPTQKPLELMEYLIKTYTNEGETVLDFTMGSGSTGVAASNLKRNFIGIEMDKGYFDIASERINKKPRQIVLTL
jgi:site-specific DNA-methyltransferase (adenine-specific)